MNSLDRELVELHRKEKHWLVCVQSSNVMGLLIAVEKATEYKMAIQTAKQLL
jgi:hypothetical protein